jgi:hypothetical protein
VSCFLAHSVPVLVGLLALALPGSGGGIDSARISEEDTQGEALPHMAIISIPPVTEGLTEANICTIRKWTASFDAYGSGLCKGRSLFPEESTARLMYAD